MAEGKNCGLTLMDKQLKSNRCVTSSYQATSPTQYSMDSELNFALGTFAQISNRVKVNKDQQRSEKTHTSGKINIVFHNFQFKMLQATTIFVLLNSNTSRILRKTAQLFLLVYIDQQLFLPHISICKQLQNTLSRKIK